MKAIKKKIYSIQAEYVLSHFEKIIPVSGEGLFNSQCHSNAVQYARKHKQNRIAMVFLTDREDIILHQVNVDKNGRYVENTLGYQSEDWDYFFVKHIEAEFRMAHRTFIEMRGYMKRIVPWYLRWSKHAKI